MAGVFLIATEPAIPFQLSRVRLDGRDFTLDLKWNMREGRWYLSILDEENIPLVMGRKLVTNWPLLRYYHGDPRVPPGELAVTDLTGDGTPPGFEELGEGRRCELTYFAAGP